MLETEPGHASIGEAANLVWRPLDAGQDVARLTRLVREIAVADDEEILTETQMARWFETPGLDAARDCWVIEAPDDADVLIAQGLAQHAPNTQRTWVQINVHPNWRGRGLGSALLARAVARARQQGSTYVIGGMQTKHVATRRFVERHGFHWVMGWVRMSLPGSTPVPAPSWPAGYTVRSYAEVQDPTVVREALNRGFIGHWENRDRPLEDIQHRLASPEARPEGILLAFGPAGDIAGICNAGYDAQRNAEYHTRLGHIHSLAVVPEHRRGGVGRALLFAGIAWLRAQGQDAIELDAVTNNQMALPLYHAVGFAVTREGCEYRLDLEEPTL